MTKGVNIVIYALGSHAKFKMMFLEDMKKVIDNIEAFKQKSHREPYLYITGILHPQFWDL